MVSGIFVGKEAEGRERGVQTLFIGNADLPLDRMLAVVDFCARDNIKRVYFGAGNARGISDSEAMLAWMLSLSGVDELLVEVDDNTAVQLDRLPPTMAVRVIYTIRCADKAKALLAKRMSVIKFVSAEEDNVYWYDVLPVVLTSSNDELYSTDKEVLIC